MATFEKKICIHMSDEMHREVKALPRSFNLSEKMREKLREVLDEERGEP